MNANLSRALDDAEIKKFLRDNQREVEQIFEAAFKSAQARGEIGPQKNPVALAKFFLATIQGMRALGRLNHMLRVPPHTRIAAHSHRDDRVATVISGTWRIGYGDKFDQARLKALPPGSFHTEPPGRNHFAETGDDPVVVQITGYGPSSTEYVDRDLDPRNSKKPE